MIEEQDSIGISGDPSMASSVDRGANYGDSNSGSSSRGTSDSSTLKQLYSSTEKTTSSSLKLVMQLIVFVYLVLLLVSSLNLGLSLTRYT